MEISISRKKYIIRGLVLVSCVSYIAWMFGRYIYWEHIDHDIRKLLEFDGYGSSVPESASQHILLIANNTYILWLVISCICWAGLWFFYKWGRDLLAFLYFLSNAVVPFSGINMYTPLEQILMNIYILTDGVILGLTYIAWPYMLKNIAKTQDTHKSEK